MPASSFYSITGHSVPDLFAGGLFARPIHFFSQNADPVLNRLFIPLFTTLANGASTWRLLQSGRMNVYLFYIFSTTIGLLGWALFQLP